MSSTPHEAASVLSPVLLYVEDNILVQMLGETVLREAGYDVFVAADGETALDLLGVEAGRLASLLTDIHLGPGIDGWELARRARAMRADLPVLYLSGGTEMEWEAQGVAGSVLVVKPFIRENFLSMVGGLIQAQAA